MPVFDSTVVLLKEGFANLYLEPAHVLKSGFYMEPCKAQEIQV